MVIDDLTLSPESSHDSSSSLASSLLSLLLSPDLRDSPALSSYLLVALGDGLATLALFIPFTFLPDLAVSRGVEPNNAAFLISAAGMTLSHGYGTNPAVLFQFCEFSLLASELRI